VARTFASFEEFGAALTRLYQSTLRLEANQKQSDGFDFNRQYNVREDAMNA